MRTLLSTSLLLGLLSGCGGATTTDVAAPDEARSAATFPSSAELEKLAAAPAHALHSEAVDVPTWDLAGPFPAAIDTAATPGEGAWGAILDDAARRGGLTPSAAMHCLAREVGRFYLHHKAMPGEIVRRYLEGWCGSPAIDVSLQYLSGDVPADVGDDEVLAQWKADAARLVDTLAAARHAAPAGSQPALAGIWFGRGEGRATVVAAMATPIIQLETTNLDPDPEGVISLRGTLLVPSEHVRVLVNRGRLAAADCSLDERVALPRFEALCLVDPADSVAWIELGTVAPGRVLGATVLRILARRGSAKPSVAVIDPVSGAAPEASGKPDGSTSDKSATPDGSATPDAAASAVTASLGELANRARIAAGLPPLVAVASESAVATRLAPLFFAETLGGDPAGNTDRIALGLMAGWDVPARINHASFYSSWSRSTDARYLIAAALDSPTGRSVLLDPEATQLAIGGLRDATSGVIGGLFVTYHSLAGDAAATRAVMQTIQAARLGRGLPQLSPFAGADAETARVVAGLQRGELSPQDALDSLLAFAARTAVGTASGTAIQTASLDKLTLPAEAYAPGENYAAVVATPYRPPGEPWWRWVVVIVVCAR